MVESYAEYLFGDANRREAALELALLDENPLKKLVALALNPLELDERLKVLERWNILDPRWIKALKHQEKHGWAVFPDVVPLKVLTRAVEAIWVELDRLSPGFDKTKSLEELIKLLPQNKHHILQQYRFGILDEVLEAKVHPRVEKIFRALWKVDDSEPVISSQDALSFMLPETSRSKDTAWWHIDQSPHRKPLLFPQEATCIQGSITATHIIQNGKIKFVKNTKEMGGLRLIKDSHKKFRSAFEELGIEKTPKDWYLFKKEVDGKKVLDIEGMVDFGAELDSEGYPIPIEVESGPGDLVVWDSRMIHCGARPKQKQEVIRVALYECMMPKKYATPNQLKKKWKYFCEGRVTSHWPFGERVFPQVEYNYGIQRLVEIDERFAKEKTKPSVRDEYLFGKPE